MTTLPSPEATRRPGVVGRTVRLSDGRTWGFASPSVFWLPVVTVESDEFGRPVERVGMRSVFGHPPEVEGLAGRLRDACLTGSAPARYAAFFRLAASLLRRCHEIDPRTACELLAVPACDLPTLVREVLAAARGDGEPGPPDEIRTPR